MAAAARGSGPAFFDRGTVDAVSFLEHLRLSVPPPLADAAERLRYCPTVFVAPPWPEIFATDAERRHGFDEAVAQYASLRRTYERLGYRLVELPKIAVAARAQFVIDRVPRR